MREHIKVLGILNIIMGAFTALTGILVLIIMGGMAGVITAAADNTQDKAIAAPIIAAVGIGVAIFLLILSAPSIIGGWGLIKFKPWSRILVIILSILHLFNIPFGTALGVYGLWVLLNDDARRVLESGGYVAPLGYPTVPPVQPQTPTYQPPPAL